MFNFGFFKELAKIRKDTLQKPNGKYDKQALQMFVFSIMTIFSGSFIIISDLVLTKEINPYAIAVVGLFGAIATGQAVINVWNKKVDKSMDIDQNNYTHDGNTEG